MIWIQQHAELLFCLVGCMLVTVIPRVGPVMYLHAESLPDLLRHWLSVVPVAVLAALLVSLVGALLMARRVSRPLDALVQAAERIGGGDYRLFAFKGVEKI